MKHALLLIALLVATPVFAETAAPSAQQQQQRAAAEHFGARIEQALNERNKPAAIALIDMHALAERAADYQGLTGQMHSDFVAGAEKAGANALIDAYFKVLDSGKGKVKFMRATNQFPPRSLVRFDLGDHGFNYCEFIVATDSAGQVRAVDWYQLATGDLMSVTLGGIGQMFLANNAGPIEKLLGAKPQADTLAQMRRIGELQRAGKYAEALALYKNLKAPIGDARFILTARASAAMFANQLDEYDLALARMAELYSNDPGASFMLIDYYFKRQDLPKLLTTLDTVEKRVGRDGITRMLRANSYFASQDLDNALKTTEEAIALEPDRMDPYDLRATFLVSLARYPEAVAAYRDMEQRFDLTFTRDIFTSEPTFEQFVKSAAFRAWLPK